VDLLHKLLQDLLDIVDLLHILIFIHLLKQFFFREIQRHITFSNSVENCIINLPPSLSDTHPK